MWLWFDKNNYSIKWTDQWIKSSNLIGWMLQVINIFEIEPGISCHDLHHDTSCLYEYFYKMANTMKRSAKLYFVLHFVSFLVFRLRKIKDRKKLKEALMKLVKMYFGSMLFLSSFVANTKLSLCINSYLCGDQPVFDGIKAII